jgi:hypothetical protein
MLERAIAELKFNKTMLTNFLVELGEEKRDQLTAINIGACVARGGVD